jgi:hypothetical protein
MLNGTNPDMLAAVTLAGSLPCEVVVKEAVAGKSAPQKLAV